MRVAFRVLGPMQVLVDGIDVTPAGPKERSLLALLVLNAGRVVSADRIIDELWPTVEADRARHALQVRVAELRKLIQDDEGSPKLEFVAPGYRLEAAADEIDEQRFLQHVARGRAEARQGDVYAASVALREAVGLWRGDPLADVVMTPWLDAEVARLAESRIDALEDCIDAELACGYHQALTFELDRLVAEHPLRERLWAQRALALYRCGRQAEALRACNAIRRLLADEVGVEPGPALRDLERAMLEQRAELDWSPPRTERRRLLGPDEQPPVHYAQAPDGVRIAYQVAGDGPVDLIIIPGFTSHLDIWWEPWSGRLARRLMSFSRLIVFDKRGMGLSDRPPRSGIEHWMEDTRVVLDAVGSERAVVLGMSAGGTVGVLFAATYPQRTRALILYGASPRYLIDDDYPTGMPVEAVEPLVQRAESKWGTGVLLDALCPSANNDPVLRNNYARFQRASASPGAAAAYLRSLLQMDVRHALPLVSAPTLVLHATGDIPEPVERARYTAARIPNAKLVELDSADHLIWLTDALDLMVNEIQDFVTGAVASGEPTRVLATVLSIDVAAQSATDEATRVIDQYRGTVVRCDDGILATFDGPARAIRCAVAIVASVDAEPAVRAGLHCGECELIGHEVAGVAVQIARTIMRLAPPRQVVVSQTVRDLVVGSGITFTDHGTHALDGVPGRWTAYLVAET